MASDSDNHWQGARFRLPWSWLKYSLDSNGMAGPIRRSPGGTAGLCGRVSVVRGSVGYCRLVHVGR